MYDSSDFEQKVRGDRLMTNTVQNESHLMIDKISGQNFERKDPTPAMFSKYLLFSYMYSVHFYSVKGFYPSYGYAT